MLSSERLFQFNNLILSSDTETTVMSETDKHLANNSIIVFINPKSGGLKGKFVYEKFKEYLKIENIFDLSKTTPGQG